MAKSLFQDWPRVRLVKEAPKDYDPSAQKDYSKWSPERPYFVTLEGGKISLYVDKQMLNDIMRDYKTDLARIMRDQKCTFYKNGRFNRCCKDCTDPEQCVLYLRGFKDLEKSFGGEFSVDSMNDEESEDDRLYELPDDSHEDVLDKMIREERHEIIRREINSLEEKLRLVVKYTFYENLNPYEIEKKYKIPSSTVQDRLKKAIKLIGKTIKDMDEFKNL